MRSWVCWARLGGRFVGFDAKRFEFGQVDGVLGPPAGPLPRLEASRFSTPSKPIPHMRGDDVRQLWRRIAFSILISNTDDHLRTHGFLRTSSAGWSLSPAFDLNPDPRPGPKYLSTTIDFSHTAASVETLMGIAEYFRSAPTTPAASCARSATPRADGAPPPT